MHDTALSEQARLRYTTDDVYRTVVTTLAEVLHAHIADLATGTLADHAADSLDCLQADNSICDELGLSRGHLAPRLCGLTLDEVVGHYRGRLASRPLALTDAMEGE